MLPAARPTRARLARASSPESAHSMRSRLKLGISCTHGVTNGRQYCVWEIRNRLVNITLKLTYDGIFRCKISRSTTFTLTVPRYSVRLTRYSRKSETFHDFPYFPGVLCSAFLTISFVHKNETYYQKTGAVAPLLKFRANFTGLQDRSTRENNTYSIIALLVCLLTLKTLYIRPS